MKRVADGGRRGSSETSLSTFCKRPRKASGSRSLPPRSKTRSLKMVERSKVPSIYHALFETKQFPNGVPATLPAFDTSAGSLWIFDRFNRIFRYAILALVNSLHRYFDLRGAVVRHRDQVQVLFDTLRTLNTRCPAVESAFVIGVQTEGRLLPQNRPLGSIRSRNALAGIVIDVNAESWEQQVQLFLRYPSLSKHAYQ